MHRYEIRYSRNDMPSDFIGVSVKYARDKATALKYLGSKPDKTGSLRLKRGGVAKILSVTELPND